ncbi:hypothetical protein HPB48_002251 [Haemaphysalis longicornis]|uniref:Uncharacterized protein n=1 Tax=Haemaphysalis longicornis TaxID=44386 RepID=A0A9J6FIV9_HAELO|nr:hypothetical protein HPB48_002251 [Haemaphysalis longicornis]
MSRKAPRQGPLSSARAQRARPRLPSRAHRKRGGNTFQITRNPLEAFAKDAARRQRDPTKRGALSHFHTAPFRFRLSGHSAGTGKRSDAHPSPTPRPCTALELRDLSGFPSRGQPNRDSNTAAVFHDTFKHSEESQ